MQETLRHQKAFDYYYGLGQKRNITKVARRLSVCRASVSAWSRAFDWQERITERDKKNSKAIVKKTDKEIQERDTQNIRIAREAIKVFALSLVGHVDHKCECGKVERIPIPKAKLTADQFDKMVRLGKFIIGEEEIKGGTVINVNLLPCEPQPRQVESEIVDG